MNPATVASTLRMPDRVLFLCSRNAVRSPMAQALGERYYRRQIQFQSAGLEAGALDPFAIAVMMDIGLDITNHQPQSLKDLDQIGRAHV